MRSTLDTASISSSSYGSAARNLSSTPGSVTRSDNPTTLGSLDYATTVSTDGLPKPIEAKDLSVEEVFSNYAREFLLSARPLASLRATLQDLIVTVPEFDPPGVANMMLEDIPLKTESEQRSFAQEVEEDTGLDGKLLSGCETRMKLTHPLAAFPHTLPEFIEAFHAFVSNIATLRGVFITLERLVNTTASRRQGGLPLTDLQHSPRQPVHGRQEPTQRRPARPESFDQRNHSRTANAVSAVDQDQAGWISSTARRVADGISWLRVLATSIKSRMSGIPHAQQGVAM